MLSSLRITNLAQLQDTELELGGGLTAITGETGAGKTMVLTALRLLTGGRADAKMVALGQKRIEVDASARVSADIAGDLEDSGFTLEEGEAIFSRTVLSEGGSRAAISGRPVPAKRLAETFGTQVTIHGQADQWRLRTSSQQRSLLDSYAGQEHQKILKTYGNAWAGLQKLRAELEEATANRDQRDIELQYLQDTLQDLDALAPDENEEEQLESAITRLTNVEGLREATALSAEALGEDGGAADALGEVASRLRGVTDGEEALTALSERASTLETEARALTSDLRDYSEQLFDDPAELARLHERKAKLTELMRGRALNVPELLGWAEASRRRVAELLDDQKTPEALQDAIEEAERQLAGAGQQLTASRREAARALEGAVENELRHLALADATFIVALTPSEPTRHGFETVRMALKSHDKAAAASLGDGVSGGELSRIMLALEVALGADSGPGTMVFDEIDAGIGGEVANQLAARLKLLSQRSQVVVVTHLPQVAALADTNFAITKKAGSATVTRVEGDAKTDELVRMLGGSIGDDATRQVAIAMQNGKAVGNLPREA